MKRRKKCIYSRFFFLKKNMLLFFYKAKSRQIVDKEVAYAINNFLKIYVQQCLVLPHSLPPSFLLLFPALNSQCLSLSALLVVHRPKLNHILSTFAGGSPSLTLPAGIRLELRTYFWVQHMRFCCLNVILFVQPIPIKRRSQRPIRHRCLLSSAEKER